MKIIITSLFILTLGLQNLIADKMVYKYVVEGKTTDEIVALTYAQNDGLEWEIYTGSDGFSKAGRDKSGRLVAYEYTGKDGKYVLKQEGDVLKVTGKLDGKALNAKLNLNGKIWSFGFDQALRWANKTKVKSLVFFMPDAANLEGSREMEINFEVNEVYAGKSASRYKVNVTGLMSLFWSASLWLDASTGMQTGFRGNQGPGTPEQTFTARLEKN